MKKHKDSVNFIDFRNNLCASCSDDASIVVYNYGSYRQEGILKVPLDPVYNEPSELKICKFLGEHNCIVTADIDGFLHFFAVTPSPRKNEHLLKVSNVNISQVGTQVNYPIRAIDFDEVHSILYTGDEMGYIQRWDLTQLFSKLKEVEKKESKTVYKKDDLANLEDNLGMLESASKKSLFQGSALPSAKEELGSSTFVTGLDAGGGAPKTKIEFSSDDVKLVHRWAAHSDTINWVTYTP
jgi:WD40 repeat protein